MININEILKKTDSEVPPLPALKLTPVREKCGLFDSKLGGMPYFPKNMEYPRGTKRDYEGKPLRLLVQLNFEQLPHIEDFPQKGILQIFIACEDDAVYGYDIYSSNDQTDQNGFRVIYHENIITDTSQLLSEDELPLNVMNEDEYIFPFKGEFLLKAAQPEMHYATFDVYRFEQSFMNNYNDSTEGKIRFYWDIGDEATEMIQTRNGERTAFIGGYPVFEQDDPRSEAEEFAVFDRVLFELLSLEGEGFCQWDIIWGDVGTGCFMIPAENLKKCDFSQVLYNYDCG